MTSATVTEILELLAGRREHCHQLLELSRQQRQLIDSGDLSQLVAILGQKQRILGRLDAAKKQCPDLPRQWALLKVGISPEVRQRTDQLLEQTKALLDDLLQEEQRCTERLTKRRDATRQQLQSITQGTQIHDAYREQLAPSTHRHLNVDQ